MSRQRDCVRQSTIPKWRAGTTKQVNAGRPDPADTPRAGKGPLVLLFYDGYELKAAPGTTGHVFSTAHSLARHAYRTARRRQVHTGFYAAFLGLKRSLAAVGCDVRVNDFARAKKMPDYPIGLAGYPSVIDKVDLPNPVIFGPGDFGSLEASRAVAANSRFRYLIQPSTWFRDYYAPYAGEEKMVVWFAGIDTDAWPDWSHEPKATDVLVYDKIRWDREARVADTLEPLLAHLREQGRSYEIVRYGHHHQSEFISKLKRARSLAFVCEHETQGLAYQEAMSANVPIFAWDEGKLIDPSIPQPSPGVAVSSVPYFDERCGVKFTRANIAPQFEAFWAQRAGFQPREYVLEQLSLKRSGALYLDLYRKTARTGAL